MKDLLLIKKINPIREANQILPYTFQLDYSFNKQKAMDIFCDLKNRGIIIEDEILIKDKAFTVKVSGEDVIKVIKEILDKNLKIYAIYIAYDEYLEKGEINE